MPTYARTLAKNHDWWTRSRHPAVHFELGHPGNPGNPGNIDMRRIHREVGEDMFTCLQEMNRHVITTDSQNGGKKSPFGQIITDLGSVQWDVGVWTGKLHTNRHYDVVTEQTMYIKIMASHAVIGLLAVAAIGDDAVSCLTAEDIHTRPDLERINLTRISWFPHYGRKAPFNICDAEAVHECTNFWNRVEFFEADPDWCARAGTDTQMECAMLISKKSYEKGDAGPEGFLARALALVRLASRPKRRISIV
jgi:hypothetical protein